MLSNPPVVPSTTACDVVGRPSVGTTTVRREGGGREVRDDIKKLTKKWHYLAISHPKSTKSKIGDCQGTKNLILDALTIADFPIDKIYYPIMKGEILVG